MWAEASKYSLCELSCPPVLPARPHMDQIWNSPTGITCSQPPRAARWLRMVGDQEKEENGIKGGEPNYQRSAAILRQRIRGACEARCPGAERISDAMS